jgi:hypothetical protein
MDYPTQSLQGIVIAEAEKLGLEAPIDVVRFIINLACEEVEDEIEKLWAIGKRPEGSWGERFTKAVRSELKAHNLVLEQLGR